MSASNLRELILYRRRSDGLFIKVRRAVPTFSEPQENHEVYTSRESRCTLSVFAPDETFAMCWGLVMICSVLYQVLTVPYYLAFDSDDTYVTLALDFVCTIVYFFDILVTFNTSFYRKGILIEDRKAIFVRYMRTWLLVDVLSSFPYNWTLQSPFELSGSSNYKAPSLIKIIKISRMLRSFRLVRVAKIRQQLALLEQKMSSRLSILVTTVYLCLMMTSIAHVVACGFYYMSTVGDTTDDWIYAYNLEGSPEFDKYISALYWAITTLTTTGYGDIVPVNTVERLYGIVIMILSAAVFSYLIGKIGTVIALIEKDSSEHKELIIDATRFLKSSEVPEDVQVRALRYLEYVYDTRKRRKVLDTNILTQFSEPLRNEISDHIFGKILLRVPALLLFHRDFISQLARSVHPEIFAQDDVLFEGSQLSSDVYFLEKGSVEIYHKPSSHTFTLLKVRCTQPGMHFGEVAFFTGCERTASARCLQFSEVLTLSRNSILEQIKLSPDAMYMFQVINDKFQANDFRQLGIRCYFCNHFSHLAVHCQNAKVLIEREPIAQKWLRKRYSGNRAIQPDATEANFERRRKRVRPLRHYSKHNVSSQGWERMKGWGYGLTKAVQKMRENVMVSDAEVVAAGERDEMEYCPIDFDTVSSASPHRKTSSEKDDLSPLPQFSRRFSVIAGVRAYALNESLGRSRLDEVQDEGSSEHSSEGSECSQ